MTVRVLSSLERITFYLDKWDSVKVTKLRFLTVDAPQKQPPPKVTKVIQDKVFTSVDDCN